MNNSASHVSTAVPQAFFLVGPTASGKSSVAQYIAERAGRIIVSADSMNLYRGMDIGTAKPSSAERAQVKYFGVDLIDPTEKFNVAAYLDAVRPAFALGKEVIVVGGTGLYVKCLAEGFDDVPPECTPLRAELELLEFSALEQRARNEAAELYDALTEDDRRNPRRLIRILERSAARSAAILAASCRLEACGTGARSAAVSAASGRLEACGTGDCTAAVPAASSRLEACGTGERSAAVSAASCRLEACGTGARSAAILAASGRLEACGTEDCTASVPAASGRLEACRAQGSWNSRPKPVIVGLHVERKVLVRRIEERVEKMYAEGLLDEARALMPLKLSATALQAIGYAEALAVLRGEATEAEAKEKTIIRTRQLAKRQMTWFRNQLNVEWIHTADYSSMEQLAGAVMNAWGNHGPTSVLI